MKSLLLNLRLLALSLLIGFGLTLGYAGDADGIAIDFSHCGYRSSEVPLPEVEARLFVRHSEGDVTAALQAAIDQLSTFPLDEQGFRGALLLDNGSFEIGGQLKVAASGIVLRGSGNTTIRATGTDRRPVIRVMGKDDAQFEKLGRQVTGDVAVGSVEIPLDSTTGLLVGGLVRVTRPSTKEWIEAIGMDRFLVGWRPGSRNIQWERRITAIADNTITVDAPITTALETRFGGGRVQKLTQWPGRHQQIGIEGLTLESIPTSTHPKDEDHAWVGITMGNVQDAWVRQVTFRKFTGSAVMLWETSKNVTVKDCLSLEPISEIGGHRRDTFFTAGQQTLFLRCWAERGIRDFTVGHCAAGPNAFVACESHHTLGDSGSIGSWASGILYDNVNIHGGTLKLDNQWVANHSAGWSAANSVLWQCTAAELHCSHPPTAKNWARGVWGRYYGDGDFGDSVDEFVSPSSLFQGQLAARSVTAAKALGQIGQRHFGATNPSYEQAADFVNRSNEAAPTLRKLIENAPALPSDHSNVPVHQFEETPMPLHPRKSLKVVNGWLTIDGKLVTGEREGVPWWRGNTRPNEAASLGRAITRFVPGRVGLGYTDDLNELAQDMLEKKVATIDHNYGLWYDRRRDDHTRVQRADGHVLAPFYEQPFARSGKGRAWDGLSLYDLERPNPWYWSRLKQFADLAERDGLALYQQHYFQHNLLEAGAHWTDSPWRSANNINDTGFPEPPPYMGDKRIFQAHLFYDVTDPQRRKLHRQFIRQSLANFDSNTNVIHFTSAEFTGPLEFVQFWVDTVMEWERETGTDVMLGLSCTKDVQDAILEDPIRGPAISVIDIRYWHYASDGDLYAPTGGMNLSPRQHKRRSKSKSPSLESTTRAVREYRMRYPDKAVVVSNSDDGWAVLMGGGSLPNLTNLPPNLLVAIPKMLPTKAGLGDAKHGYLINGQVDEIPQGEFIEHRIDRKTNEKQGIRWLVPTD